MDTGRTSAQLDHLALRMSAHRNAGPEIVYRYRQRLEIERRELHGVRLVGNEGVSRSGRGELRDRGDITRADLREVLGLLALSKAILTPCSTFIPYLKGAGYGRVLFWSATIRASIVSVVLIDMVLTLLFWGGDPGFRISG